MYLVDCICEILSKGGVFLLLQTRTAKLRIFPDEEQSGLLLDTMRAYTSACNFVSDLIGSEKVKADRYRVHDAGYRECGYTTNDDRIGAMNLQKMGTKYLLKAQVS